MISKATWAITKTKIVGEIDLFPFEPPFVMQTRQNFIKNFKTH